MVLTGLLSTDKSIWRCKPQYFTTETEDLWLSRPVLQWFHVYISNRKQCVRINGYTSPFLPGCNKIEVYLKEPSLDLYSTHRVSLYWIWRFQTLVAFLTTNPSFPSVLDIRFSQICWTTFFSWGKLKKLYHVRHAFCSNSQSERTDKQTAVLDLSN